MGASLVVLFSAYGLKQGDGYQRVILDMARNHGDGYKTTFIRDNLLRF